MDDSRISYIGTSDTMIVSLVIYCWNEWVYLKCRSRLKRILYLKCGTQWNNQLQHRYTFWYHVKNNLAAIHVIFNKFKTTEITGALAGILKKTIDISCIIHFRKSYIYVNITDIMQYVITLMR